MRDDELYHFGILGMKWGVRRYQNEDGSWTDRGKSRRRSNEPHKHKRLTKEQKEKLKKIGKAAAIGAGVTGAVVGGAILAKKFGPRIATAAKTTYVNKIKGPNLDYASSVKARESVNKQINGLMTKMQKMEPGSKRYNVIKSQIKQLRGQSFRLGETSLRTGSQNLIESLRQTPSKYASYHISKEGTKVRADKMKESYKKVVGLGSAIGATAIGGATAYAGAAAADKLFDERRDKRIARRNGAHYVKRPMNARASDYMFPRRN